jgi:FHA domain-containing protein
MVLRAIEHKIEALVEGVFGRAFRTNVQPVELARKLAKEMDDHRQVSVSRVYVPNEYRAQFEGYEESLVGELQEYLAEHARREGYALLSSPKVALDTDEDLEVGEFGIATRMVQPEHGARDEEEAPAPSVEAGATMIYKPPAPPPTEAASPVELGVEREVVALVEDGQRHEIRKRRTVIGRSKDCDIQLADPNISRRHAELRQEGTAYWIVDLDSTNGIEINGHRVKRAKLDEGDTVTLGSSDLVFERSTE